MKIWLRMLRVIILKIFALVRSGKLQSMVLLMCFWLSIVKGEHQP